MGSYTPADHERWVPEPGKGPGRTAFARDRARVLHSAAWRRLAARTQVVAAGQADFPRTRMTHSLECAQVGRELGDSLGCDPDLVETACLAHDLGHPPFGHNGEAALAGLAAEIGGFEGNAQTLRILTRLEPKMFGRPGETGGDPAERSVGLNLTRAALDATTKYPWTRDHETPKFGVYADDLAAFRWLRAEAPTGRRCFEAQVMDWSDDVSYSVHDVEDGIHAGHINLQSLRTAGTATAVCEAALTAYAPTTAMDALLRAYDRLAATWPVSFAGTQRDQAALKNMTSTLIGRFTTAAERATRAAHPAQSMTRYGASLIVPDDERNEVAVLKAIAYHFVMQRSAAMAAQARQREQLAELVVALWNGAPKSLPADFQEAWAATRDDGDKLRVVIDRVASLTDTSARTMHRALCAR